MENFYHWFWALDFPGKPLPFFGREHQLSVLVILLVNLLLVWWGRRANETQRRYIRKALGWILLVNEVMWHLWALNQGYWNIHEMLPFHMCSVMVWLSVYMLLGDNLAIYPYAYFLGIGGAIQALITPDTGIYNYPHFRVWQTFISHGTLVLVGVYLTWGEGRHPSLADFKRVIVSVLLYALVIFFVNFLVQGNYLFLRHHPTAPTLIDFLGPWPMYILPLVLIALVVFSLMYLPWWFVDRRNSANR